MQFTAKQIATLINASIEGDDSETVQHFNNIEAASPGDLSFLANPKYEDLLYQCKASIIIVNKSLILKEKVNATLLRVDDAYAAFAILLQFYQQYRIQELKGIEDPSYISKTASIGKDVYIGAFSYIGDKVVIGNGSKIYPGSFIGEQVKIGENTIIYPSVSIYHECIIGNNVIIHSGAVIGADGFGFVPQSDGTYQKIPQIGNVVIENEVEIGANTTIDRATLNSTIIKTGVKIDNLVQIAHNVELGENTAIAAQAGISGSTKTGKNVMIAGQAGIAGHISLADQTTVTGQSGVSKSVVKPKQILTGSPAFEYRDCKRSELIYRKLPSLEKKILELEKLVKELSKS